MDMVTRYMNSKAPRVVQSQQIPNLAVNFVDVNNQFQVDFITNQKPGDPTQFTDLAQNYYNNEVKNIVIPQSFQPTEQGIPLMEYTPATPYYNPGSPNS